MSVCTQESKILEILTFDAMTDMNRQDYPIPENTSDDEIEIEQAQNAKDTTEIAQIETEKAAHDTRMGN